MATRKGRKDVKAMKSIKDGVVKIDAKLLDEIEKFIKKPENRLLYVSKKQLVNLAIIEFLNLNSLKVSNKKELKVRKIKGTGRGKIKKNKKG